MANKPSDNEVLAFGVLALVIVFVLCGGALTLFGGYLSGDSIIILQIIAVPLVGGLLSGFKRR
jgi:hypothetical protein